MPEVKLKEAPGCFQVRRMGQNFTFMTDSYRDLLDRAASEWGIEAEFWDIWGHLHVTAPETKAAILKALGVGCGSAEELEAALAARRRSEWSRLAPPCLVASVNRRPLQFPLRIPEALAGETAAVEIRLEAGEVKRSQVDLGRIPATAAQDFEGIRYVEKPVELPGDLPLGYHEVTVALGGGGAAQRGAMRLILTPDRAYLPPHLAGGGRYGGIAVSLYGVRSERNWGCGDFRDLRALIQWAAEEAGASFVGLNPLHAIHNRRPYNTSPYLPLCIFYQNFIYLDVESIEDFQSPRVQRLWARPEIQSELEALRNSEYVEYERVSGLKLRFLKLMFASFLRGRASGSARWRAFREFAGREGDLLDRFATYCALDEHLHRRDPNLWIWPEWPEEYRNPDSPAVRAFQKKHWRSILFFKYLQWQLELQLAQTQEYALRAGLPVGLYHDLALATDRCGADLWAHRPFYVAGCRVGSPPDDFSPGGQDWAFPPPNHGRHREDGYTLFAESIRKNCRHGGALRIDHVMRFFRLFWIPDGLDPTGGAYVRDHWEDLIRILALESVRNRVLVVGEDLGTVEPGIRDTLGRFGILSYRLLYFERNPGGEFKTFREYPAQALASVSTHDLPTLAGFWINADIEARRRAGTLPNEESYRAQLRARAREKQALLDLFFRLGLLPPSFPRAAEQVPELTGELHNAAVGFLASTPCLLMLINQEDLTKETAQQNLPGTTDQYPNWSRKMKYRVEELRRHPTARDFTAMYRHWLERTGRLARNGSAD